MNGLGREQFLTKSAGFMLGLCCLSLVLATWFGLKPLSSVHWSLRDAGFGVMGAGAMLATFSFISSTWSDAERLLGGVLAKCRWYDLLILSVIVGVVEELLFRGVLEPWVARLHPMIGLIGVNLLFGLLHAVSVTYAIAATLLGSFLSVLAQWPGEYNLLRPMVAHAVYDFVGFVCLASSYRQLQSGRAGVRSKEAPESESSSAG